MAASASHGVVRGILRRGTEDAAVRAVRAARDAIESRGGFLVVTDAPDRLRDRLEMWGPPPETAGVLEKIRAAFDPEGILNPGRFLVGGGTSERGRE
jgi:glycolate oxidase FAD binding subunit